MKLVKLDCDSRRVCHFALPLRYTRCYPSLPPVPAFKHFWAPVLSGVLFCSRGWKKSRSSVVETLTLGFDHHLRSCLASPANDNLDDPRWSGMGKATRKEPARLLFSCLVHPRSFIGTKTKIVRVLLPRLHPPPRLDHHLRLTAFSFH